MLSAFPTDSRYRDGHRRWCTTCGATYNREYQLRTKYGLTLEQFGEMHTDQGGRCAACDDVIPKSGTTVHVDHDHVSGAVRALLCRGCNRALGLLQDDARRVRRLADYIEHHHAERDTAAPIQ